MTAMRKADDELVSSAEKVRTCRHTPQQKAAVAKQKKEKTRVADRNAAEGKAVKVHEQLKRLTKEQREFEYGATEIQMYEEHKARLARRNELTKFSYVRALEAMRIEIGAVAD